MKWKDRTPYSRDDEERTPTTWSAMAGQMELTVTCGHIYYPGTWIMHFGRLIDTRPLDAKTIDEAKREAVRVAFDVIRTPYLILGAAMEGGTAAGGSDE